MKSVAKLVLAAESSVVKIGEAIMKITVIGGGSSYTPELINGFLERTDSLPMDELWLLDVLPERLEVVGGFAQRMVEAKGSPFTVHLTTDQRQAVRDAQFGAELVELMVA